MSKDAPDNGEWQKGKTMGMTTKYWTWWGALISSQYITRPKCCQDDFRVVKTLSRQDVFSRHNIKTIFHMCLDKVVQVSWTYVLRTRLDSTPCLSRRFLKTRFQDMFSKRVTKTHFQDDVADDFSKRFENIMIVLKTCLHIPSWKYSTRVLTIRGKCTESMSWQPH